MIASFKPCTLQGTVEAPPSKSMAHRYLIGAALSGAPCRLTGVDYNEDILASMDCLRAMGAEITAEGDLVEINPHAFLQGDIAPLRCRESGSTLRFLIPLALCTGKPVTFHGSERLLQRPLSVYEDLCREEGFLFEKGKDSITVCGRLQSKTYQIRGDVSSQFITGMILALVHLGHEAAIDIIPPLESRPYIDLTLSALRSFGASVGFSGEHRIEIHPAALTGYSGKIEGDYSGAAFLEAFNRTGSHIRIENLREDSLQGDRVYNEYFDRICEGTPTLDISDCPDLGPVLFAVAALKNGATFTGTDRLKAKESDRGMAMHEELQKLGGGLLFGNNTITVKKQTLQNRGACLEGHNDHRIVMALSVILSRIGGQISGIEAIKKSYPGFFHDIQQLGAEVDVI